MKNYLTLSLFILLMIGCGNDQSFENQYDFDIIHNKQKHEISSKADLMEFVMLITDDADNHIIDVEFKELSDDNGPFDVILAKHKNIRTGKFSEIYHVLNLLREKGSFVKTSFFIGCSMKCDATFCTDCSLTINESCKKITCSCSNIINAESSCSPNIIAY